MRTILTPFAFLVAVLAGWLNERQQLAIDFLREENRVLRKQLGKRRLRLTDDQRRRLAAKGHKLGRKLLSEIATIVTPDTILRWHRELIARKWTFNRRRTGRPGVMKQIEDLVVRMASENPRWGYRRIQGALSNLGHQVAFNTVKRILRSHGIEPAPERGTKTTWAQFLKSHWSTLAAADFFTAEVWTPRGLVTYYVLFALRLKSRKIQFLGATPRPNATFMKQAALVWTDPNDGFLRGCSHLVIDRDSKYTAEFEEVLRDHGVKRVRIPVRSPNCSPHAERFVLTAKTECLERMILFGERSLARAIREFETHYNTERHHQGLGNRLLKPMRDGSGAVVRRERLGGLLNFYYRCYATSARARPNTLADVRGRGGWA
ncbi:MAG: transposase [Planctomycetes bacterium]|nr:transposase [Planctomycetota bacterium]